MNNPEGPQSSDPHPDRSEQTTAALSLKGVRLLIVDDEADTRELLAFVLTEAGALVTSAESAAAALAALSESSFNVLISDIGMPGTDGYTLIQQVRELASEQGGNIPAIALTAYAGDADQQRAIAAGFDKHISKPVDPSELVALVAKYAQTAFGEV